ncbi:MAG: thiamine diphosphokinase [Clostridiaceae bacterium]|nr:thiamine diphosphokinase [Clostridiaceae bacterium]
MRNVLILGGDDISYEGVLSQIGEEDLIICADHGADHARAMKLNPNIIVGDMDSVHPDTLAWAQSLGAEIQKYPVEKDMTDSEIALDALDLDFPTMVVLSLSGRIDHVLSNFLVAGRYAEKGADILMTDGKSTVKIIAGPSRYVLDRTIFRTMEAEGETLVVSMIPLFGDVQGVTTSGLYYPLTKHDLICGSSFSVSNKAISPQEEVGITFDDGVLAITATIEH